MSQNIVFYSENINSFSFLQPFFDNYQLRLLYLGLGIKLNRNFMCFYIIVFQDFQLPQKVPLVADNDVTVNTQERPQVAINGWC